MRQSQTRVNQLQAEHVALLRRVDVLGQERGALAHTNGALLQEVAALKRALEDANKYRDMYEQLQVW